MEDQRGAGAPPGGQRRGPLRAFLEGLETDIQACRESGCDSHERYWHEPYRRKLYILRHRLKASSHLLSPPDTAAPEYVPAMERLASHGESAYRALIDETPGLLDYFYEATPVEAIGLLNIGSRPSHRKQADRSNGSIRAIPWVFGWAQSRHTVPAWYGLGSALALSLSRRNPYLDPLNHIQITLLRRFRDPNLSEQERERWLAPMLRTISAIATGMRNTG